MAASQNELPAKTKTETVKRGSIRVKIYPQTQTVAGKRYLRYEIIYYSGAQRKRRKFSDYAQARREAENIAGKLAQGENEALKLTSLDRAAYVRALELLKPSGADLCEAAKEFANAKAKLPGGVSLQEAVAFYNARNPGCLPAKSVSEVVRELLAFKEKERKSERHLRDLRSRLGQFAEAFSMPISSLSADLLQQYFDSLEVGPRSKRNLLTHITLLFNFAIKRKYLTKYALEELEALERPNQTPSAIEVFTPEEIAEILQIAPENLVPGLAISAFAGLRSSEVELLDWREVQLSQGNIVVPAAKAKTRSRRIVPIVENLRAWLTPYARVEGKVLPYKIMGNQFYKLAAKLNKARQEKGAKSEFKWKCNAIRHSFVSYRLALIKNEHTVALEAGNSPGIIFQNYRALVTEEQALRYFSVKPEKAGNVIEISKDQAA